MACTENHLHAVNVIVFLSFGVYKVYTLRSDQLTANKLNF